MQAKFYWGQNEDCSPGDSTSGSSGKLPKMLGRVGKFNIYVILVKGEFMQSSAYLFKNLFIFDWRIIVLQYCVDRFSNVKIIFHSWGKFDLV